MHSPADGPHSELYREFIDYIRLDIQRERLAANRRMLGVFLWCFIIPAAVAATVLVMVKLGFLPKRLSHYMDWLIVIFPVLYGIYMLSSDAIRELPVMFRRGGIAATLSRALDDERWRSRVCQELKAKFLDSKTSENRHPGGRLQSWRWLVGNFAIDLQNVQNRTRYLTALAGAVFFLIFQGIDAFDSPHAEPRWSTTSIMGWFEASSSSFTQFFALGIFLLLLYVSGNQIYHSLERYLHCAQMIQKELESDSIKSPQ
jgi:hypothetical protein